MKRKFTQDEIDKYSITLYHASDHIITEPSLDVLPYEFGSGFYLYENKDDAIQLARLKGRNIINKYSFIPVCPPLNTRTFAAPNEEWLDMLLTKLQHNVLLVEDDQYADSGIDVINGPGMNQELIEIIGRLLTDHKIEPEQILLYARNMKLPMQWLLKTDKAFSYLKFVGRDKL